MHLRPSVWTNLPRARNLQLPDHNRTILSASFAERSFPLDVQGQAHANGKSRIAPASSARAKEIRSAGIPHWIDCRKPSASTANQPRGDIKGRY